MRERLIELIQQADAICGSRKQCEGCAGFGKGADCVDYHIADYLLENGVIVPPCQIDTHIYVIPAQENGLTEITEMVVRGFAIGKPCNVANCFRVRGTSALFQPSFEQFGKTVFLTKEEAERALKGGVKE